MRTFSQTQPKQEQDDRQKFMAPMDIVIKKIVISDKTKYGLIAKVDGYNHADQKAGAWYTTGEVLIKQLQEMLKTDGNPSSGDLKEPVRVLIKSVKGKNNQYLTMADP